MRSHALHQMAPEWRSAARRARASTAPRRRGRPRLALASHQGEHRQSCDGRSRQRGLRWHRCATPFVLVNNRPCCGSLAAARSKVEDAVHELLLECRPEDPCSTRWLTCVKTYSFLAVGTTFSMLLRRGWLRAFAGMMEGAAAAEAVDDEEKAEDSFAVMMGKRMRRGSASSRRGSCRGTCRSE